MEAQKHNEPLIVLFPDTLPDPTSPNSLPYAVMIELGHTNITHTAVLRPRRLQHITRPTFLVLGVEDVVVVVFELFDVVLFILGGDLARTDCAGFVVDVEANARQDVGEVHVDHPYILTGHVFHYALGLVKDEPAHGDQKVEDLHEWVVGLHQVVLGGTEAAVYSLPEYFLHEVATSPLFLPKCGRELLKD